MTDHIDSINMMLHQKNGKCCIGQTTRPVATRFMEHRRALNKRMAADVAAAKASKQDVFQVTPLHTTRDRRADSPEQAMIQQRSARGSGRYNLLKSSGTSTAQLSSSETRGYSSRSKI